MKLYKLSFCYYKSDIEIKPSNAFDFLSSRLNENDYIHTHLFDDDDYTTAINSVDIDSSWTYVCCMFPHHQNICLIEIVDWTICKLPTKQMSRDSALCYCVLVFKSTVSMYVCVFWSTYVRRLEHLTKFLFYILT